MLPPPPPAKEAFETNSLKIVGFLSLILFTSSITMVVFVLCRRRNRQQTSRSGGGSELNNLTESGKYSYWSLKDVCVYKQYVLTPSQTSPGFNVSVVEVV